MLAPTRELAQQIEEETRVLASFTPYRVTSVVGGQSIEEQARRAPPSKSLLYRPPPLVCVPPQLPS